MLSSCPVSAFVVGVKIGSGRRSRARQVPAHHALDGKRLRLDHDHRAVGQLVRVRPQPLRIARDVALAHVVRHRVLQQVEPEQRELRQHAALARDGGGQHYVERAQAIGGDDQQLVAEVVHVADLSPAPQRGVGQPRLEDDRSFGGHLRAGHEG
jgi:hypothetical protein